MGYPQTLGQSHAMPGLQKCYHLFPQVTPAFPNSWANKPSYPKNTSPMLPPRLPPWATPLGYPPGYPHGYPLSFP